MMTEEQIKELATLAANVRHLVDQTDSIKRSMAGLATREELREFVTRTHHDAEFKAMNLRVDGLQKAIDSQSPMSVWDKAMRLVGGLVTIGAMLSMVFLYARKP